LKKLVYERSIENYFNTVLYFTMIDFLLRLDSIKLELRQADDEYTMHYDIPTGPDWDYSANIEWWTIKLGNLENRIDELNREEKDVRKEMKDLMLRYGWEGAGRCRYV
jgi:hypothetical protein